MPKRSNDSDLNSKNLLEYFQKVPNSDIMPKIDHRPKRKTPQNFYENCLNDQYLQIDNADNSEDGSKQISLIEVEDDENSDTENYDCNKKMSKDEVRHSSCAVFQLIILSLFFPTFQKKTLKNDLMKLDAEFQRVRKLLRTALQVNLQKDLKLTQMENKLKEAEIKFDAEDFVVGDFCRFVKIFTEKELARLRGLPVTQSSDSAFLRFTLNYLYKDDLNQLSKKSTTGRNADADPISPQKMCIMQSIFNERIDGMGQSEEENERRKKRFKSVLAKIIDRSRAKKMLF